MKMLKNLFFLLLVFGFTSGQTDVQAQGKINTNSKNVAIGGYDLVAYFTQNAAIRGSKKYAVEVDGATFYFSSEENQKKFKEAPKKYLPQFGGYCAFAMASQGVKAPVDPKTFKLHDGKLFLFFNDYYQGSPFNTIVPWNNDEPNLISKANANWEKMK